MTLRERIETRVKDEICRVCVFRGADGQCYSPDPQGCGILRNLDQVIAIVRETRSERIDPYLDQVRSVICTECANEDERGMCPLRDQLNCALDDYVLMLVEIVEDELNATHAE